jgi:hypothetical protein
MSRCAATLRSKRRLFNLGRPGTVPQLAISMQAIGFLSAFIPRRRRTHEGPVPPVTTQYDQTAAGPSACSASRGVG